MLEILLMCYFWISGSRKKFVLCKVQTFLQRIKIYQTLLFRKEFEDHKNTELLIVKVSDFPQEKSSWSCNHIPKAEQRLEEGLKKQLQIIAKFKSKDKKSFVNLHYLWTLRYRKVIFVNSFGDYVAMVSFKTHIQISCARSYLAQCLFVSNFGSNFDGKKVTSRQKIMQAVSWGGSW